MGYMEIERDGGIATVRLARGKVNAVNSDAVRELRTSFDELAHDDGTRAVVLTGKGRFFSFGFDVPEIVSYSKETFTQFVSSFTRLYTEIFLFPKPVVAALNGHTIAGGCMLAIACDRRVMASEHGKISLNEITFGSSVFAGSVEMLRALVGAKHASEVLYIGRMYSAAEALEIGLVDEVVTEEELVDAARRTATRLAEAQQPAFRSMKHLLRGGIADEMKRREATSIAEFVDIWYSESTRSQLERISIR